MDQLELDEDCLSNIDSLIPKELRDKIDAKLSKKSEELTTWKSKFEKHRVNSGRLSLFYYFLFIKKTIFLGSFHYMKKVL